MLTSREPRGGSHTCIPGVEKAPLTSCVEVPTRVLGA